MNIFYLDRDAKKAAQYHCDKHVVKMILESAQLLSTAHRLLDGVQHELLVETHPTGKTRKKKIWTIGDYRDDKIYGASHINHPSAIWVREDLSHYQWLWNLAQELCQEYRFRYGDKQHKTSLVLSTLSFAPNNIRRNGIFTEPPQAMPDDAKVPGDSVEAYRNYYRLHKRRMANWKIRGTPFWYK